MKKRSRRTKRRRKSRKSKTRRRRGGQLFLSEYFTWKEDPHMEDFKNSKQFLEMQMEINVLKKQGKLNPKQVKNIFNKFYTNLTPKKAVRKGYIKAVDEIDEYLKLVKDRFENSFTLGDFKKIFEYEDEKKKHEDYMLHLPRTGVGKMEDGVIVGGKKKKRKRKRKKRRTKKR